MTHFVVTVCLSPEQVDQYGVERAVELALEPFNENTRIEPYREYEEGGTNEFWWVQSMRDHRADVLAGTGIRPYDPDVIGWSNRGPVNIPEDKQRETQARNAAYADQLGENPDWELVAKLYNECYHYDAALAVEGDTEINVEKLFYDKESNRGFKWTQYNPESQWDWWTIGGRWQRRLVGRPNVQPSALVFGRPGTGGDNGRPNFDADGRVYCDGGQLKYLDLQFMRDESARERLVSYDQWWRLVEQYGVPRSWESFCGAAQADEMTYDEARRAYGSQEIIKVATKLFDNPFDCLEVEYGMPREEFERDARLNAFVGYAVLTTKGEWTAPGRMGWWATSSESPEEKGAFKTMANQYIDALPEDTWIISVDCHI